VCQKPADRGEPLAPYLHQIVQLLLLDFEQLLSFQKALRENGAAEKLMPTFDPLLRRQGLGQRLIHVQHHVRMILEYRIGTDFNREHLPQLQQAFLDPAAPMLEGAPGECILTAQESAAHAAGDTMVVGCVFQADQGLPGLGHERLS